MLACFFILLLTILLLHNSIFLRILVWPFDFCVLIILVLPFDFTSGSILSSYSHLPVTSTMKDVESGDASPEASIHQAFADNLATMASKPGTKGPTDALKAIYAAGKARAAMTMDVLIVQSLMAGLYIGMATHLLLAIGGGVLGAIFFPIGLLAILLTSAELFTGDILIFLPSLLSGHVSVRSVCRNWTVSYFGNMAGCVAWAYFMVYLPGALEDIGKNEFAIKVALAKANQTWGSIFLKGIGANFMVCLAIWQATCAEEVAGKLLAIFLPLSGFVLMGLEHCIANQFIIRKLLFL
jgi:formate/nitrite transporter